MTKNISELLQNTPKQPPLKPWPQEGPKTTPDKMAVKKQPPPKGMNTQFRLQVWFKTEFANPRSTWFTNGLKELEEIERSYGTSLPGGEIQALYIKLRRYRGRIQRVVIYDKRPKRTRDIIFEWLEGLGITHNTTKGIDWKAILE
jgi:hypothetical protein